MEHDQLTRKVYERKVYEAEVHNARPRYSNREGASTVSNICGLLVLLSGFGLAYSAANDGMGGYVAAALPIIGTSALYFTGHFDRE